MADAVRFGDAYASVPAHKPNMYKLKVVCQDRGIFVEAWLPETVGFDVQTEYETPFAAGLNGANQALGNVAKGFGVNLTTQAFTMQVWQGSREISFQLPLVFQTESSGREDVQLPIARLLALTMPTEKTPGGLLEAPGPRIDIDKLLNNTLIKAALAAEANGGVVSSVAGGIGSAISGAAGAAATALKVSYKIFTDPAAGIGAAAQETKNLVDKVSPGLSSVGKALINSITNNISLYIGNFLYFPSVVITDVSQTYDVLLDRTGQPQRATVNVSFKTFYVPVQQDIEQMFPAANIQVGDLANLKKA